MPYDLEGARKAGGTDSQIAEYLAGQNNYDLDAARKAGGSDTQIVEYLASIDKTPPKQVTAPEPATVEPAAPEKKLTLPQYSRPIEATRMGLRGLTLGASDVLGAGVASGAAMMTGANRGQSVGEVYRDIKTDISGSRDQYRSDHPVEAAAAEIGGAIAPAILTAGASTPAGAANLSRLGIAQGAGRLEPIVNALSATGDAVKALPYAGKAASAIGQGAVMGSVYGGTQADVGEEGKGAAIGAGTGALAQYGINKLIGAGSKLAGMAADKGKQLADEYLANNTQNIYNTVKVTLENKGIDFTKLGTDVQDDLMSYAAKAMAKGESPENAVAIANQAVLNKLPEPIKATAGTLNRDFIQQEKEGLLATGSPMFGGEVRKTLESYAPQLAKNLEIIRAKTGGADVSKGQIGKGVQSFTNQAEQKSAAAYKALYDEAERAVGDTPVLIGSQKAGRVAGSKIDPLTNTLLDKPTEALAASHNNAIDWLVAHQGEEGVNQLLTKAKNLGAIVETTGKNGEKILQSAPIPLSKLKDLRSYASRMQKNMDQSAFTGGEYKKIVDSVIEEHGGDLYQKAAQARRAHALQYESGPRVISDMLVGKARSETDKALNFDSVVDNVVLSGSRGADDIKKLYSFMVKDPATRIEGLQQIKNIRGATLDHIYEQATAGQAKFSPAALNKAIKGIGGIEKLEQILGKKGAAELKNFQQAADILMNKEKSLLPNSATAGRLAMMAEGVFGRLKNMPAGVGTAATVVQKGMQTLGNASTARNAMRPVDEAVNLSGIGANALLESPAADAARKAAVIAAERDSQ